MAKAKQRFSWTEKPATGEVSVLDTSTQDTRTYSWDDIPATQHGNANCYFIKKFLQDRASSVDADDKFDGFDEYWTMLCNDKWEKDRVSSGPSTPAHITLIMEKKGITSASAQASWAAYPQSFKDKFLEANKDAIAEIKARSKEEVSLDDMI